MRVEPQAQRGATSSVKVALKGSHPERAGQDTASPHERLGLTGQSGESHLKETGDRTETSEGDGTRIEYRNRETKQNIHLSNIANMRLREGS